MERRFMESSAHIQQYSLWINYSCRSIVLWPASLEDFGDSAVGRFDLPLTPRGGNREHNGLGISGDCEPLQCLPTGVGSAANLNRLQPASACATLDPTVYGADMNPPAIGA